jgi:kynurenine formamidase
VATDVEALIKRVSNWGRWGPTDELGTVNYIGPAERQRAARLVRTGHVFSLAMDFESRQPQPRQGDRLNPWRFMASLPSREHEIEGTADDVVMMSTHGATHWDALAHVFHRGKMYNDRDASLVTERGAAKNGIAVLRDRLVARALLVDVARCRDVDALEPGYEITVDDLERALHDGGVDAATGDVLLVRTGRLGSVLRTGAWDEFIDAPEPGIGLAALPWLHEKQVAAIATDTWAVEVLPSREPGLDYPVHAVAIPYMGLLLGEMFALDELAGACAADAGHEMLLCAAPLPFVGGVGSPVNPIAVL